MKTFAFVLLASVSLSSLALAEDATKRNTMGTIETLDPTNKSIVLSNGSTYLTGEDTKFDSLKAGSMVWMNCDQTTAGMSNCSVSSGAQGRVKSTDTTARTITLEDGTVYTAPADMDLARFQSGSEVDLGFNETDGTRTLSNMSLVGEGKISAIDSDKKTLTFEDGTEYTIGEGVTTDQFQPGADVRVSYDDETGKRTITNISGKKN